MAVGYDWLPCPGGDLGGGHQEDAGYVVAFCGLKIASEGKGGGAPAAGNPLVLNLYSGATIAYVLSFEKRAIYVKSFTGR